MDLEWPRPNRIRVFNDKKLRIFGPLVLFAGGALFFRLNWYLELPTTRIIRSDLIAIVSGYICWNLNRWVFLRLQYHFPGLTNTRKRLLCAAILLPSLLNFAWLIRQLGHYYLNDEPTLAQPIANYTYAIGIQLFYHCIYFVIYEGEYVLKTWRQVYEQNERLKKNKLQQQLDTLKSQINPHFLFNSLNSLSMLIHDNPKQAEAFVDEISSVYRYLLRANDQELTTLDRELDFIRSYMQLLQTRYGKGISFQMSIDDTYLDRLIPPLTLQLLVENAVKHNAILPENPLQIALLIDGESLIVKNNLQRKKTAVLSNKVGLANIATKYRLLGRCEIAIHENNGWFMVTLPLLAGQPQTNPTL